MPTARVAAGLSPGSPATGDRSRADRRRGLPLSLSFPSSFSLFLSLLSWHIHYAGGTAGHHWPAEPSPDARPAPVGVAGRPPGLARRQARCRAWTNVGAGSAPALSSSSQFLSLSDTTLSLSLAWAEAYPLKTCARMKERVALDLLLRILVMPRIKEIGNQPSRIDSGISDVMRRLGNPRRHA